MLFTIILILITAVFTSFMFDDQQYAGTYFKYPKKKAVDESIVGINFEVKL